MRKETLKGGKMVITSYIHRLDPSFKVCNSMLCSMYYCTRIKLASKNIFQIEAETLNVFKRRIKISGEGLPSQGWDQKVAGRMNDKLLVEVQGENGAYYKAFVTDVFAEEIKLAFEHDWQPESR